MNKITKLGLVAFSMTVSAFAGDVFDSYAEKTEELTSEVVADSVDAEFQILSVESDCLETEMQIEIPVQEVEVDEIVAINADVESPITEPLNGDAEEAFSSDFQIVSVYEMTEEGLEQMLKGSYPEIVVEFPSQIKVPLQFFLRGDLVNFVGEENKVGFVETAQTFYLRSIQEELFLSTDLTQWVPFLDFVTGELFITLNSEEGNSFLGFGIELNKR